MKNNLYHITYLTVSRNPLLHQVRDLGILMNLYPLLENNYQFRDFFLNQPNMNAKTRAHCDFEFLPNDLLVMTTRPPLHEGGHRPIYQSGHFIEQKIMENVSRVFSSLSREVMYYQENIAKKLKKGYENRATIEFYVNRTRTASSAAGYKFIAPFAGGVGRSWQTWSPSSKKRPATSCGFILYFKAEEGIPQTLIVFGMGGEEGLIFSRILRNGLWNELNIDLSGSGPSRAIMVEFAVMIPNKPLSLSFVDKIKGKVILDTVL